MKGFLTSSFVHSIEKYGDNLYVAGGFNGADGITSPGIIRWDGTEWQPMDGGVSQGVVRTWVNDIAINSDSTIFISGNFTYAGGEEANFIAYWENGNWNPLLDGINNGVSHAVMSLCINSSDEVYAGGYFQSAGGHSVSRIARWTDNDWIILGDPANSVNGIYVEAIETVGNDVYAGGYFTFAGTQKANNIARLSEDFNWSPLNGGTNGSVNAIEQSGDSLIVGGHFSLAGGLAVNNIAVWDGANWSSLGEGLNGSVTDILAIGDNIYAGGSFSASGGLSLNNVACWDKALNEWRQLGSGTNGIVSDLEFYNGGLCVGGSFNRAGNIDANFIAYWDGFEWSNLGNGPTNMVLSIAVFSNELYAAADQGVGVCRWNGDYWIGIGTPWTLTLSADENYLYAGGAFYEFEGAPGNCIASWDGQSWSEMGSGTDGTVHAMAVSEDNSIYLGGTFTCAGNKPSYYFARWNESYVGVNEETILPDRPLLSGNYPNPFNAST
ncbi:MAG: hypothetical protein JSW64_16035, partial [Candidatus Zixiibacteriota bacterium]